MPSHRTLSVQSPAIPLFLGQPALEPVRLSGHEGLNSLFEYELLLKTPDALNIGASSAADFDLDAFIGREIGCTIELDGAGAFTPGGTGPATDRLGAGSREINALITDATLWGEEGRHVQYRLTLRPWLHLATLSTDCRIFQDKTVVQILDDLLADYAFPVEKRLFDGYPVREFQVQFNESDFEFFERLCQEWGISYHFEHSEGKHRLVLSDAMAAFRAHPSEAYREVEYHAPGWKTDAEYVHSFSPTHRLTSGRFTSREYDYTRPRADLTISRKDPRPTGQADGEVYQYHAASAVGSHYAQPRAGAASVANDPRAEGQQLALLRMQALRTDGARARASGNLRGMVPGCTFHLRKHPRQKANSEYLVLETELLVEDVGQDSQPGHAAAGRAQHWRVKVDFTAHPVSERLSPVPVRPKPRCGPVPALVVGPEGENIWTDALGRIKVKLPWDRRGEADENSSCWLRVSTPWAGNQLGAVQLPRIGQEVTVDFYGGDADQPFCVGQVYNQANMPPYALPGQQALSGIRTRELGQARGNSAAGPSNSLTFDDTAGKMQVQLKSDHQHSQLSLGHITRIEDNAGRKDPRGQGFDLRTDGWGAVRSEKGLLLTTDGRSEAVGGMLSRDELVTCLEKALFLAKELGKVAAKCEGATRETEPQQELGHAVDALGHGANNESGDAFKGRAAGGQPVLALSGAAGLAMATPQDLTQYAGVNIDTVAGVNQQHYAGRSILQSATQDIEQFAHKGEIRHIASEGRFIQQAQHNSMEITAEKGVNITSTEDGVVIQARKCITLALEDGTYLRMHNGKVDFGMNGKFTVHSASHGFVPAATLPATFPKFYKAEQEDLAEQLLLHRNREHRETAPERNYRIFNGSGDASKDTSGADAISKLQEDKTLNAKR